MSQLIPRPKRILSVFGTRPEAIKMAPLVRRIRDRLPEIDSAVCVTGQHRQMLDQVLEVFSIVPTYDLNVMQSGQSLTDVTAGVLISLEPILKDFRPDIVLVHGDTTTSLAASLSAYYHRIPVGHVEAGLRTGNINSPWPEELNRCVNSLVASLHFAPTLHAKQNLLKEGVPEIRVTVTGNTVIDALLQTKARLDMDAQLRAKLADRYPYVKSGRRTLLVTGHRRESFGSGFMNICRALSEIHDAHENVQIIYPVHLNPNVSGPVRNQLSAKKRVFLIEPVSYIDFVYLMDRADLILTDSGGVQEEAPSLGKPVLVMRDVTERPEAVEAGAVMVVGTSTDRIVDAVSHLLGNEQARMKMSSATNPYGDGLASERITDTVRNFLQTPTSNP